MEKEAMVGIVLASLIPIATFLSIFMGFIIKYIYKPYRDNQDSIKEMTQKFLVMQERSNASIDKLTKELEHSNNLNEAKLDIMNRTIAGVDEKHTIKNQHLSKRVDKIENTVFKKYRID